MSESREAGFGWHNWVLEHAKNTPDAPALVGPDETLTYRQLAWRAGKWASALSKAGVKPGQIVVTRLAREFDAVATIALSMLGAVSASNTAKQYYDFEPITDWLITRKEVENYPAAKQVVVSPIWIQRAYNDLEPAALNGFNSEQDLTRLVFTSGTTGRPKAVPLTVWQLDYRTRQGVSQLQAPGAILAIYDMGSAAGFVRLTGDMLRGEPFLYLGSRTDARDPVKLSQRISIIGLQGSPGQVQGFLDVFLKSPFDFSNLKFVRSGGASVPQDLQRFVEAQFGFPLEIGYGSTEAGYMSVRYESAENDSRDVGAPLAGVEIEVVDEQNQPVPVGEVGIVRLKTPDVVAGYYKDPDASAKAFRDGWFYPGDTGYLTQDNHLVVGGRVSEFINLGGLKLDPTMLDTVAAEVSNLSAATQIAAFGYHDSRGQVKLGFAYQGSVKPDTKAIQKAIAKRFLVKDILFMPVLILPTNEMGKIKRSSLSEMASGKNR